MGWNFENIDGNLSSYVYQEHLKDVVTNEPVISAILLFGIELKYKYWRASAHGSRKKKPRL